MGSAGQRGVGTSTGQKLALVLLGCGLAMLIIEVGLRITGGVFLWLQERENRVSGSRKSAYRVLCLGESTTALGGNDAYPRQLAAILNAQGAGATFSVFNRGVPAISTDRILEDLEANLDEYDPDFVVTMMGINDGGRHVPLVRRSDGAVVQALKSLRTYKLVREIALRLSVTVMQRRGIEDPRERSRAAGAGEEHDQGVEVAERRVALEAEIQSSPNRSAYLELGRLEMGSGRLEAAEAALRSGIALAPTDAQLYAALGRAYVLQGEVDDAVGVLRKAHELDRSNREALDDLAMIHVLRGETEQGRRLLEEALRAGITDDRAEETLAAVYYDLATELQSRKRYDEAEKLLREALGLAKEKERPYAYGRLARLYHETGDVAGFERSLRQMKATGFPAKTRRNYRELVRIVSARGMRLVAVQYPLRSVDVLKEMIGTETGVAYVDNEGLFVDLLREGSYDVYFEDQFAGDFGHMTALGNAALAANVARTILAQLQLPGSR